MLNFIKKLTSEELKDGGAGGAPAAPEPAKVDASAPASNPASGNPPPKAEGDKFDELGYEKVSDTSGDKKPEGKGDEKPEPAKQTEKVENPSTGYGEEPAKVEDAVAAPAKEPEVPEPDDSPLKDVKLEGLEKTEVERLKDFAVKNKLSKEQAQAYVDLRKADMKKAAEDQKLAEANFEKAKLQVRKQWHDELKADPDFGGDKFQMNVQNAERVLHDFMPGTKKELTANKSMLPPYVMRDLAKIAQVLYAPEKMVSGDPKQPDKKTEDADPRAFLKDLY